MTSTGRVLGRGTVGVSALAAPPGQGSVLDGTGTSSFWSFSCSTSEEEDSYASIPGGRLADSTSGASLSVSASEADALSGVPCRGSVLGVRGIAGGGWAPRKPLPRPRPRPRPRPPRPPPLPLPIRVGSALNGSLGRFMRCSGSNPPLAMASSILRFFSATRAAVGQRRLRSAIHASTASSVSSVMFVPRIGTGLLGATSSWLGQTLTTPQ